MDSGKLRTDQTAALSHGLAPGLRYLARLHTRMKRTGFPPDDPLFRLVAKAYDAVQHLSVHVHYLSCQSGVGRPGSPDWPVGNVRQDRGAEDRSRPRAERRP